MSYLVLARKWRPRTFEQMMGQSHVLKALQNALNSQRLHHAYLFTGTRGVGKTTVARVFAKALNCEQGVSASPCGTCSACVEIDGGRFPDLIEVDAASRTKVDETRELLENVQYTPTRGRFKVYLIDEVHMFSNHSFNALLKTLEEPPPHVKFLLATTDPKKLPVTILSRCLQFHLKRLTIDQIEQQLATILNAEQLSCEPRSLRLIAEAADGSLRDALSLLDQAIAHGGGTLKDSEVVAMLGTVDRGRVGALLERLAARDAQGLLQNIAQLDDFSPDYLAVLGEVLSYLHQVTLVQLLGELPQPTANDEAIKQLARQITPEDCQLFYQTALLGRRDLPFVQDQRQGFEMIMLRMLAFYRQLNGGVEVQKQEHAAPVISVVPEPSVPAKPALPPSAPPYPMPEPVVSVRALEPAPTPAVTASVTAAEPQSLPALSPVPTSVTSTAGQDQAQQWRRIVENLPMGMPRQLAMHCVFEDFDGAHLRLSLPTTALRMRTDKIEKGLAEVLKKHYGPDLRMSLREAGATETTATPAQLQSQEQQQRLAAAQRVIAEDPHVKLLCEQLGAEVDVGSIRPVERPRNESV